jgi:hypothetical protein
VKRRRLLSPRQVSVVEAEFWQAWDECRSAGFDRILPYRGAIVDNVMPENGDAYYYSDAQGNFHVQFNPTYYPSPPLTKRHRYVHETGHIADQMLRRFGMTQNYLFTRTHAYRFRGLAATPATWQEAANDAGNAWAWLPVERFAELFVVAVFGYIEVERTANWGLPLDAAKTRRFMLDLVNEVAPKTWPQFPSSRIIAKAEDDTLAMYHRTTDNVISVWNDQLQPLGSVRKWW